MTRLSIQSERNINLFNKVCPNSKQKLWSWKITHLKEPMPNLTEIKLAIFASLKLIFSMNLEKNSRISTIKMGS